MAVERHTVVEVAVEAAIVPQHTIAAVALLHIVSHHIVVEVVLAEVLVVVKVRVEAEEDPVLEAEVVVLPVAVDKKYNHKIERRYI
jgi:hypothetical protein